VFFSRISFLPLCLHQFLPFNFKCARFQLHRGIIVSLSTSFAVFPLLFSPPSLILAPSLCVHCLMSINGIHKLKLGVFPHCKRAAFHCTAELLCGLFPCVCLKPVACQPCGYLGTAPVTSPGLPQLEVKNSTEFTRSYNSIPPLMVHM
jgi:hypothetical protein